MKLMIPSCLRQCDKCEQRKERIEELYEQLQAKDTTIKKLNKQVDQYFKEADYWESQAITNDMKLQGAKETIKEQAEKIEKLTVLLKEAVTKGRFPVHAEPEWAEYKEQHGI